MKAINLILLIGLTILAASCKPKIDYYPLMEVDKQMVPYELGQKVSFIDSEGQPSTLTVTGDITDWYLFEDVISYNHRDVSLQSDNSDLGFKLRAEGWSPGASPDRRTLRITIRPSGRLFHVKYSLEGKLLTDTMNKYFYQYFYDSLQINHHVYYDVIENNWGDSDSGQLFYNKTHGILQIKKEGEIFFTINP